MCGPFKPTKINSKLAYKFCEFVIHMHGCHGIGQINETPNAYVFWMHS